MRKLLAIVLAAATPFVCAADPDPAIMTLHRESDLRWADAPGSPGLKYVFLVGGPGQTGPYVVRVRFAPGTFSPPHFHPEERHIVVIKGTWWVGGGPKWDLAATTPMPAGSFVVHRANQVHYDGARDEEVIVQISGVGTNKTTLVDEAGNPK